LARATALRRFSDMAEITSVIRFIANPANTYMTGAILPVNGGAHAVSITES
jgi:3-oxoacyl-[acyl-carrier protein] reductase